MNASWRCTEDECYGDELEEVMGGEQAGGGEEAKGEKEESPTI